MTRSKQTVIALTALAAAISGALAQEVPGVTGSVSIGGISSNVDSQTVPASVLPNLVPDAVVTSGKTRPWASGLAFSACGPCALSRSPRNRRIRSAPAVMFPHWSLPPICNRQPQRS